ncbi:anti-sigma factor family protein [Halostreptopolyspora alba]|uniref:Zinc-finger domain-containing protein n=1 Tax=Halostreptopolyspora alba TaxID=2487137 RepID=A0A3N0E5S1_9ACTN|nr:hypothetical protein EFW17_16960 [Nocardiopsaceae bacterium YIM 96095]
MTSHVDTETLALSAEGLLDEAEECSVQGHLAGCEQCTEQLAALADVSRLLGEAAAPELPPDVAARIEEAVRAEAEQRETPSSADADPAPPPPRDDSVVPFPRRPSRWLPFLVGAAAAVFVVGGAGAVLYSMLGPGNHTGRAGSEVSEQERPDAALSYQPVLLESETSYTEDELDSQAAEVLGTVPATDYPGQSEGDPDEPREAPESDTPEVPADVATCARELGGTDEEPLPALIDIATFQPSGAESAEDAWVMYYGSDPAGAFEVVVVSPSCATGDPGDSVLAESRVSGS